jgi:hypothetical protein
MDIAAPQIIAVIDVARINAQLADAGEIGGAIACRGEEDAVVVGIRERALPTGLTVHYRAVEPNRIAVWSVDLRWVLRRLRAEFEAGEPLFRAELHVDARNFEYVQPVQSVLDARILGSEVCLSLRPMPVTLTIKPLGRRIDVESFDLAAKLPPAVRDLRFPFIKPAGRPRLIIEPDRITVRAP